MRQVTEIDRCILQLRRQAKDNMILADELEAKHCQVAPRRKKRTSMKEFVKNLQKKELAQKV